MAFNSTIMNIPAKTLNSRPITKVATYSTFKFDHSYLNAFTGFIVAAFHD